MPIIFGTYYPLRRVLFFLIEGGLIFFAVCIMEMLLPGYETSVDQNTAKFFMRAGVVTLIFQSSLYFFDLYDLNIYTSFKETAPRMTQAFGVGCIALAGIYYLFPSVVISTADFILAYLLVCGFLAAWRFLYVVTLTSRALAKPILVLGSGKLAENIKKEIVDKVDSGYKIIGFVSNDNPQFSLSKIPVFPIDELQEICPENKVEEIVVALDDRRGVMPVNELIACKLDGIDISQGVNFYENLTGKLMVESVDPTWVIFSTGFHVSRLNYFLKRVGDIIMSVLILVLSLPITIISAVIIKIESPGPIFYLQERVGLKGKTFKVIKFRSMGQDAEKDGAVWAKENDIRVTRFGSFMRKVRIDEIPQLINVIKGEMSFVGPRPERPVFVKQLAKKIPYYSLRHNIKPGLTGWAQICYPYGASEEDALRKLEYDLYYLKNLSVALDLSIAFRTIKTVLFRKGGR